MQVFVIFALISVLWVIYGYSLAFTAGNAFYRRLRQAVPERHRRPTRSAATFSKGVVIPELVFVAFQATFAAITCALIVGAFAERMKFSAVLLFIGAVVHLLATCRSRTWSGSGTARTRSPTPATLDTVDGDGRLPVGQGRARLRRRHRGAHQRRRRRPGRRLRDRQAHRLRQGVDGAAQPDPDHDRRLAAVGGLVRLQRRLQPRSQRRRRAGLRQHAAGHGRGRAGLDVRRSG